VFWNTESDEKRAKKYDSVYGVASCGEFCVIVSQIREGRAESGKYIQVKEEIHNTNCLILCDAAGCIIEKENVPFLPLYADMSRTHIVVSNDKNVFVWKYNQVQGPSVKVSPDYSGEQTYQFYVDHELKRIDNVKNFYATTTNPHISALCTCGQNALIGLDSGDVIGYSLTKRFLQHQIKIELTPCRLYVDSSQSKLAIIDINHGLSIIQLHQEATSRGAAESMTADNTIFQQKTNVWDFKWSKESTGMFAFMEKNRMMIHECSSTHLKDPIFCGGVLMNFQNCQVRAVMLDEIMSAPADPQLEMIKVFEADSLREARELLIAEGDLAACSLLERSTHPRIHQLVAEHALESLDITLAEKAFVKLRDYHGVCVTNKIAALEDDKWKRAEVAVYLKRYPQAEIMYKEMGRSDLAIDLHGRLGNWNRVIELLMETVEEKDRNDAHEKKLRAAKENLGDM